MTDQYTPTPDDLELFKKIAQLRYSNEQLRPEERQRAFDHFEHMLNAIESAAEQRGAARGKVEGLREAADEAGSWGPACINAALAIRRSADLLEGVE